MTPMTRASCKRLPPMRSSNKLNKKKVVQFLSCAEQEFAEAVAWYNEQSPGLGFDFAAEVKRTISRMEQHPE